MCHGTRKLVPLDRVSSSIWSAMGSRSASLSGLVPSRSQSERAAARSSGLRRSSRLRPLGQLRTNLSLGGGNQDFLAEPPRRRLGLATPRGHRLAPSRNRAGGLRPERGIEYDDGKSGDWDVASEAVSLRLQYSPTSVTALAFSPDGTRLAVGSPEEVRMSMRGRARSSWSCAAMKGRSTRSCSAPTARCSPRGPSMARASGRSTSTTCSSRQNVTRSLSDRGVPSITPRRGVRGRLRVWDSVGCLRSTSGKASRN